MRRCRVCYADKPTFEFYGRSTECKTCHLARKKAEYAADPEKFCARVRSYQQGQKFQDARRKRNGTPRATVNARRYHLAKHGITEADYDELFIAQGECCAICRQTAPGRYWCLDHDHACCEGPTSCGACIRGILCWHCNVALGHFRDDPASLLAAVEYLTQTGSEGAVSSDTEGAA